MRTSTNLEYQNNPNEHHPRKTIELNMKTIIRTEIKFKIARYKESKESPSQQLYFQGTS